MNSLITVSHLAGAGVAGQTSDQRAVQGRIEAMSEGADTLSQDCQLAAGERVLFQQKLQMDVLDPEVRLVFRRHVDNCSQNGNNVATVLRRASHAINKNTAPGFT